MVYGHANGRDHAETVETVGRYLEKGFKAIRVQSGVPGLEKVYGVGKGSGYYEPAQKGLPPEEPWDTSLYLRHTPELFRKVRDAHGFDFHLLQSACDTFGFRPVMSYIAHAVSSSPTKRSNRVSTFPIRRPTRNMQVIVPNPRGPMTKPAVTTG